MIKSVTALASRIPNDKVRILVVGDSGVGKSSLVHLYCNGEVLRNPSWTVGCNVEVKLLTHSGTQRPFFVEFVDVGGTQKHKLSRGMFFSESPFNGVILVHDVTNRKSTANTKTWLKEIMSATAPTNDSKARMPSKRGASESSLPVRQELGVVVPPLLVVGNKMDLATGNALTQQHRKLLASESDIVDHINMSAIRIDRDTEAMFTQLDSWLERVSDKRYACGRGRTVSNERAASFSPSASVSVATGVPSRGSVSHRHSHSNQGSNGFPGSFGGAGGGAGAGVGGRSQFGSTSFSHDQSPASSYMPTPPRDGNSFSAGNRFGNTPSSIPPTPTPSWPDSNTSLYDDI